MNREPVLVILNGLAVVVGLVLVALNTLDVTHLEPGAITAVVAAVAGACNLLGFAIRAGVTPVAVASAQIATALATPVPGQTGTLTTSAAPTITYAGTAAVQPAPDPYQAAANAVANRQAAGA